MWTGLALATGIVFTVLVALGERLWDPDRVVDVGATPSSHINAVNGEVQNIGPAQEGLLVFRSVL